MRLFRARGGAEGKGRAERREQSYTLMIVPSAHSRVHRLVVRERTLRLAVAGAGAAALVVALLLVGFVRSRMQSAELARLRAETAAQREKTAQLARDLVEMGNGMERLRTFEARLRTAFDLEPGAPAGRRSPASAAARRASRTCSAASRRGRPTSPPRSTATSSTCAGGS